MQYLAKTEISQYLLTSEEGWNGDPTHSLGHQKRRLAAFRVLEHDILEYRLEILDTNTHPLELPPVLIKEPRCRSNS